MLYSNEVQVLVLKYLNTLEEINIEVLNLKELFIFNGIERYAECFPHFLNMKHLYCKFKIKMFKIQNNSPNTWNK